MARGQNIGYKREAKRKSQVETKGSDESDEDYNVDEDEESNESEDGCSFAEIEFEDSFGLSMEEEGEEEWVEKKVKKITRPRVRRCLQARKKNGDVMTGKKKVVYDKGDESEDGCSFAEIESEDSFVLSMEEEGEEEWLEKKVKKITKPRVRRCLQARKKNGDVITRKKKLVYGEGDDDGSSGDSSGYKQRKRTKVSYNEEEDDDVEVLYRQEEDEFVGGNPRKKFQSPRKKLNGDSHKGNPKKKQKDCHEEEYEDDDYECSYQEEDEEFAPSEVLQNTRKKLVKNRTIRRKNNRFNGFKEFRGQKVAPYKKKTVEGWGCVKGRRRRRRRRRKRRRKIDVKSDSDFASSANSDYEYTVSEEEREQIREATQFCGRLFTSLRSSRSSNMNKEEKILPSKGKRLARKGKQKVVELKVDELGGKQVCGICLSEAGKRTVRGVLNCCSHYFCFACIMAWSKVESRCPLCKQRFTTIRKTTRAEGGHYLTGAVFPVLERDQVYQPSEEELRGYLDPYENVLCTECLHGGDDAFMLLCDLCDSPAHSYCVGLGREVPDGNWYCDGCRPTVHASSNGQATNPVLDHGANTNISSGSSPVTSVRETFDLNEAYVLDTPLSQGTGHSQPPFVGHFQANSPVSGTGAFTLFERRRIQREIHHLLNNRIRQPEQVDVVASPSGINLFGSPFGQDWVMATQNTVIPPRTVPQNMYLRSRLQDYNMPPSFSREVSSPRLSSLRCEALANQPSSSTNQTSGGFSGMNSMIGSGLSHPQIHPWSGTSNAAVAVNISQYQYGEEFSTMSSQAMVPRRTLALNPYERRAHQ